MSRTRNAIDFSRKVIDCFAEKPRIPDFNSAMNGSATPEQVAALNQRCDRLPLGTEEAAAIGGHG
jgi:hypothetical protein